VYQYFPVSLHAEGKSKYHHVFVPPALTDLLPLSVGQSVSYLLTPLAAFLNEIPSISDSLSFFHGTTAASSAVSFSPRTAPLHAHLSLLRAHGQPTEPVQPAAADFDLQETCVFSTPVACVSRSYGSLCQGQPRKRGLPAHFACVVALALVLASTVDKARQCAPTASIPVPASAQLPLPCSQHP